MFTGVEALGLTLAQFCSAGDQYELSMLYNRSQSSISKIVNQVVIIVDESLKHPLAFDHAHLLSPANLKQYAQAIHHAGAPLTGIWGFIDCAICRYFKPEQALYSKVCPRICLKIS